MNNAEIRDYLAENLSAYSSLEGYTIHQIIEKLSLDDQCVTADTLADMLNQLNFNESLEDDRG